LAASKSNRARRLERARAERRMAKLAEQQRKRRRVQAGIGGSLVLILLVLGATWLLGGFDGDEPQEQVTLPTCNWMNREGTGVLPMQTPPTDVPTTGDWDLVIDTNLGRILGTVTLDDAFCGAASVDFLAASGFYNGTRCEYVDTISRVLSCGGTSSPSYQFPTEGLPRTPVGTAAPAPDPTASPGADTNSYYPKGAILLSNVDVNAAGAQLMFVYDDNTPLPGNYTQIGTVTAGLEIIQQVATGGATDEAAGAIAPAGRPIKDLTFTNVWLTDPLAAPDPTSAPSESIDPSQSPTPATT
jgi:peptidyl-prolyl cis-trans isomerase B (cyclophilin B)